MRAVRPAGPAQLARGEDVGQRLLQEVHAAAPSAGGPPGGAWFALVHGVSALAREHDQGVDDDGQHEDRDDARDDLVALVGLVALGEPGAEPADADHRTDRHHRDVGHRHHAQAGDEHRDGERQFDFQHPAQRLVADGGGGVEHGGRHGVQRLGHRAHQQRDGVERQRHDDVGLVEDPGRDDQRQHHEQRQRRDGEDDARGDRRQPAQRRGALHHRAQRHRDHQARARSGCNDSRRWMIVSAHGSSRWVSRYRTGQPSSGTRRCSLSAASTSSARTPPISWPSSSTATPSPDGDDSAASRASRSVPSGRKKEPPPIVLS